MARKTRPSLPVLGPLEEAVLDHLWRVGEGEVLDIHRAVGRAPGTSVNTVGSALERLYRKRLLSRVKVSHAYRYQAALGRDQFLARRLIDSAGGIKSLASRGVLASFLDVVTEADARALDELEAWIAEKRRENPS